ncbi:hypothetical protein FHW12_000359 [Dokdonella fugitiva]|uniref:Uncharacterized protein n=1 Tax=Dokdonella fugitiva TaxID=328517 RepID=A0A839EYA2_9GAMM|nr:hypothetical protein [Dokdonella fugitiva]MBA8886168.1 hypothetical protein [Dokdonella fugitiva]
MLLGYGRPQGGTWSVNTANGAAIVSDTAQLGDGRPDTLTSFTWITGTQNTSSIFRLRYDWSTAIVPGLVGLMGMSLPAGTKVSVAFRRPSDTAGTYPYSPSMAAASQRAIAGIHGGRNAWLRVNTGASAVSGCEIQIWNDVNGVAAIAAAAPFTTGEAVIAQAAEVQVAAGWTLTWGDPPQPNMSSSGQGYSAYVPPPRRTFSFRFPVDDQNAYFGNTSASALDYEQVIALMDRAQPCVYVPRYLDDSGAFSAQLMHRTAIIGVATKVPQLGQKSGPYFDGGGGVVLEYPVPAPAV